MVDRAAGPQPPALEPPGGEGGVSRGAAPLWARAKPAQRRQAARKPAGVCISAPFAFPARRDAPQVNGLPHPLGPGKGWTAGDAGLRDDPAPPENLSHTTQHCCFGQNPRSGAAFGAATPIEIGGDTYERFGSRSGEASASLVPLAITPEMPAAAIRRLRSWSSATTWFRALPFQPNCGFSR